MPYTQNAMTVGHCAIQMGALGRYTPPSGSWSSGGARGRTPRKHQNLHLKVPKTGSKIDQKHVDDYAFFHVHYSTKSKEISERSKVLNSQGFLLEKDLCVLYF